MVTDVSRQRKTSLIDLQKNYFFFGARCDKAEPAAIFDFLDVRPSLRTLDAALAALALVRRCCAKISPPFKLFILRESKKIINALQGRYISGT